MGVERISRGCIKQHEMKSLICNSHRRPAGGGGGGGPKSNQDRNVTDYKFTASYKTDCCQDRDFCNDGEFPALEVIHGMPVSRMIITRIR